MNRLLFLVPFLPLCLASCGGSDVAENHRAWLEHDIDSYSFTLSRFCFCAGPHEARIMVKNDVVVSVISPENQGGAEPQQWPTLDGLFEIIADAEARDADRIFVTYDPTYSYPASIDIDYVEDRFDDEIQYQVTLFDSK
jgi:Family of unknown function (DUF6174)